MTRSIKHHTSPSVLISGPTVIVSMQALALVQQDLEGKKEELHQEVVRSTKYKNVHLKIQDAISEVSDCMTPAGSSRCSSSSAVYMQGRHTITGHLHMPLNAFELHDPCWLIQVLFFFICIQPYTCRANTQSQVICICF